MGARRDASESIEQLQCSASELARLCAAARETVIERLRAAGVEPAGRRGSHPTYALGAAIVACIDLIAARAPAGGGIDPDRLSPFARDAYFRSENNRLRVQAFAGELLRREDVHDHVAGFVKVFVQCVETMPDVLERDCGLTGAAVAAVEKSIDSLRERLYERLREFTGEEAGSDGEGADHARGVPVADGAEAATTGRRGRPGGGKRARGVRDGGATERRTRAVR